MSEAPRQLGPWSLGQKLGEGGNSVVYVATRPELAGPVALKVINERRVEQESYQRFLREVEFMTTHRSTPGLLPLLDSYLPERPTRSDRAWLATPVATRIDEALAEGSLDEVVGAVEAIARTLAALQEQFDVAHRDIKPGNLYRLAGEPLIGDFGLISLPEVNELTKEGRQMGPANFIAFEMIEIPAGADAHLADVFSLGKTLWVLATGQRWAPLGHQPVGSSGWTIGDFRPHPHSRELDQLVDRMTRLRPSDRPSKAQVVRDLEAWAALPSGPAVLDWSKQRARLREKLHEQVSEEQEVERLKAAGQKVVRRLAELTGPLNRELKNTWSGTEVDISSDAHTQNIVRTRRMPPGVAEVFDWQRCTKMSTGPGPLSQKLRVSRRVQVFRDGLVAVAWGVLLGSDTFGNTWFNSGPRSQLAPVDSIELDKLLEDAVREMERQVQAALDVLAERLPEAGA